MIKIIFCECHNWIHAFQNPIIIIFYKQKCLTYTYLHIYQSVFTWVCVCLRCAHWITHKLYEDTYPLTMLFNDCLSDSFCLGEHRSKSALVALLCLVRSSWYFILWECSVSIDYLFGAQMKMENQVFCHVLLLAFFLILSQLFNQLRIIAKFFAIFVES